MRMKCTWCDAEFEEEEIVFHPEDDSQEYCPVCDLAGHIYTLESAKDDEREGARH